MGTVVLIAGVLYYLGIAIFWIAAIAVLVFGFGD